MIIWLLLVTMHFTLDGTSVNIPAQRQYQTHGECRDTGMAIAEFLNQDGIVIEWKCVEVEREAL